MIFSLFQVLSPLFTKKQQTLYDKLGGEPAVDAAVNIFYQKIIDDPMLQEFFEGICIYYQKYKQKIFLTMAFGGPVAFTGKDLRDAHAKLVHEQGLTDIHFDRVAEHLQTTLQELHVEDENIKEVMAIAASTRDDVLNR